MYSYILLGENVDLAHFVLMLSTKNSVVFKRKEEISSRDKNKPNEDDE